MTLSPSTTLKSPPSILPPVETDTFKFGGFDIIASIVRPGEDVIHIGGTHTDSLRPEQRWPSLEAAVDKVSAKARDMEIKCRIHCPEYAGCKFGIFVSDSSYLTGLKRKDLFARLAEVLNYYGGRVYTSADVNTGLIDLRGTLEHSDWVLGKAKEYGGCGGPSVFTGDAIVRIQERLMPLLYPSDPKIDGKIIAIKGAAGKVGRTIVRLLFEKNASLAIADIDKEGIKELRTLYRSLELRNPDYIHRTHEAAIFCPADSTMTLPDQKTVEQLRCKAIIGPANDQNRKPELEDALLKRRILHPSMSGALENGAGLLAVIDELEQGGFSPERLEKKIQDLVSKTLFVCERSRERDVPPQRILEDMYPLE